MNRPDRNYKAVQQNPDEWRAFEDAAFEEAQARLKRARELNGFKSEAEEIAYLRNSEEADLAERSYWATEAATDNLIQAGDPDISPETSFEFLVSAFMQEEIARVFDATLSVMIEEENAQRI
jgi:hypothetical protein